MWFSAVRDFPDYIKGRLSQFFTVLSECIKRMLVPVKMQLRVFLLYGYAIYELEGLDEYLLGNDTVGSGSSYRHFGGTSFLSL
jgi:hypothetical protein